jgi:sugar O-acyltransferase (sialic acid O-acetyltransferase NeuD family)
MTNILAIIGAGDLGHHIAHYARMSGQFSGIVYIDDYLKAGEYSFGNVLGKISDIESLCHDERFQNVLIGIGYKHMRKRKELYDKFSSYVTFPNLIHQSCYIDSTTSMGRGNIILPGCIIDKNCFIGNNIFINPGTIIAHDCVIGDNSFFGAGVNISGFVKTGACCFFGTGTSTVNSITIGHDIFSGAGAVITRSLTEPGKYVGVPAFRLNH